MYFTESAACVMSASLKYNQGYARITKNLVFFLYIKLINWLLFMQAKRNVLQQLILHGIHNEYLSYYVLRRAMLCISDLTDYVSAVDIITSTVNNNA